MQKLNYQIENIIYHYNLERCKIELNKFDKRFSFSVGIIIDTALSIPPYTGVTYRLYYLSRKLSSLGVGVKIFCCNRNIKNDKDINQLIDKNGLEIHIIPASIFYNVKKLSQLIRQTKIDILQMEDPVSVLRYQSIANILNIPICLEMHDLEPVLLKYFGRPKSQIDLSTAISGLACQLADLIICTAMSDFQTLAAEIKVNPHKLKIVHNPVDFSQFIFFGPNNEYKNILFIGNMFYKPNRVAAEYILNRIYFKLVASHPDVFFTFVGLTPESMIKKYRNREKAIFTGVVNDLNNVLGRATIALCPVTNGSGMKVKILNYCAAGLPIITTSIGASGYEKITSLIVEDNLDNYCDILNKLLCKPNEMRIIGKKNYQLVKNNFDVNIIAKQIAEYYRELIIFQNKSFAKHKVKKINLPLPMWLEEKRVVNIKNSNYYIINNDKARHKKISP